MNIETYRVYCLSKKGVTEAFPFDAHVLVFKVMGKMFALTNVDLFESVNLKCDPDWALELREQYACIKPGFHMNKHHWNTIMMDGSLRDDFIKKLIDHSYEKVVDSLPKKLQAELRK